MVVPPCGQGKSITRFCTNVAPCKTSNGSAQAAVAFRTCNSMCAVPPWPILQAVSSCIGELRVAKATRGDGDCLMKAAVPMALSNTRIVPCRPHGSELLTFKHNLVHPSSLDMEGHAKRQSASLIATISHYCATYHHKALLRLCGDHIHLYAPLSVYDYMPSIACSRFAHDDIV